MVYADRDDEPLYLSEDRANTREPIGQGLPAARPADNVRFHPSEPGGLLYAGDVSDDESQVFASRDGGRTWEPVGDPFPKVWRVEVAPAPA